MSPSPLHLGPVRAALAASWSPATSYRGVWDRDNPALGQCYPTARVVQHLLPAAEVVKGTVWTGAAEEVHFWNVLPVGGHRMSLDLTWEQFPAGSRISTGEVLDRTRFSDSAATVRRCDLLLSRVLERLHQEPAPAHVPR